MKANPKLAPELASIIVRMLEKPVQKRFNSWDEIIQQLQAKPSLDSTLNDIVVRAIAAKNEADLENQRLISELNRKAKEKETFCKLIYSQFDSDILTPIREFVEDFNSRYAGTDKYRLPHNDGQVASQEHFSWALGTPSRNTIKFEMEAIVKENFKRQRNGRLLGGTWTENYVPQYENKDILAWGKVDNSEGFGFNIILTRADGLYGDWYIAFNTNSGLANSNRMPQPFAFDWACEIKSVN